jgi:pimeloyl-ACP methyl ester carboxylesterase
MGAPADSIAAKMRRWPRFHDLYLNQRLTPAEIVQRDPSLAGLWYDKPGTQYGRPLAFYRQLQALDLTAAWSRVTAPVLAVRGEYDWIMSAEDAAPIVNTAGPGAAPRRMVTVPRAGHALSIHPSEGAAFRYDKVEVQAKAFDSVMEFLKAVGGGR